MGSLEDFFGPPISTYTREDALADGMLKDVTADAAEAGFTLHTAMTLAAWHETVAWTDEDEARKPDGTGQDERGRLWDVLSMARITASAAIRKGTAPNPLPFRVLRVPREGRAVKPRYADLVMHVGPGDDAEPVLTIMRVGES
jgi:hypothetical protein